MKIQPIVPIYLLISALICLQTACVPTYNATPSNPALLKEKGETKVSTSFAGRGLNGHVAYAVSDRFALNSTVNFYFKRGELFNLNTGNFDEVESNGFSFDIMPGYYYNFNEQGVVEVFAGYGIVNVESPSYEGNFHKLYLQPSLGWAGDRSEGALSLRVTRLIIPTNSFQTGGSALFFEPSGTIRFGAETVKGYTQIGLSFPTMGLGEINWLTFDPFFINLGIQFTLRPNK